MPDSALSEKWYLSKYVWWLLEALESQNTGLVMSVTQDLGAWYGKMEPDLKQFSVENIPVWGGGLEENVVDLSCGKKGTMWLRFLRL